MSVAELDRLIVENLSDLDAVAKRIEELEERIWVAYAAAIEAWAKDAGWTGDFETDDDFVVLPRTWQGEDRRDGWFEFGYGPEENGLTEGHHYFYLTRLAGAAGGRHCLWFVSNAYAKDWKPIAKAGAASLREHGFTMTDRGKFYIDCTPAPGEMADAIEQDDFTAPLTHVRRALDRARAAEPVLSTMLKKAAR